MPLKRCKSNNKSGWKWGDGGHCYIGKDGKKKAIKQGIAIEGPDKFKKIMAVDSQTKEGIMSLTAEERQDIASNLNMTVIERLTL